MYIQAVDDIPFPAILRRHRRQEGVQTPFDTRLWVDASGNAHRTAVARRRRRTAYEARTRHREERSYARQRGQGTACQ